MKRKLMVGCLAAVLTVTGWSGAASAVETDGNTARSTLETRTFAQPEDLGTVLQSISTIDTAYGTENGKPVMYTSASGTPSTFNVIDLQSNQLLRTFPLPGVGSVWTHTVDASGNVYIAGDGKLYRYSPTALTVMDMGAVPGRAIYGLSTDEAGNVYGGSYPNAKVFKYDVASSTFRDYGTVQEGQDYVRGAAYYGGSIYAGIGSKGSLVKVDAETGAKTQIPFPERPDYNTANFGFVYDLNVVGKYLFVHLSTESYMFVYDLESQQWTDVWVKGYRGLYTSPELDGKTYFVAGGKLQSLNLTTLVVEDTGIAFGTYLRHSEWVEIPGDPDLPGKSLVTIQFGGAITYFNLTTKKVKTVEPVVQGNPIEIQSLGKDESGKLYASGYMGTTAAQVDPVTGNKLMFPLGQAEGMVAANGKMYFGLYTGAVLREFDPAQPVVNNVNPRLLYDIAEDQDRPFAMLAAAGKLFAGTIPTYGQLGGAVTVVDQTGPNAAKTYRNVVQDQSVIGLAYRDGKLYGSTSIWGGLGIDPSQTEAKLFVMNPDTGEKLKEVTPQLPGAVKPKAIGGLSFGPDGLLWGAAYGTIFAANPDTLEIVKSKEIKATDWNFNHLWRPTYLHWGDDGLLYTTVGYNLTVIDPSTLEHKVLDTTALMVIGDDGHLYYTKGSRLARIQVSDTDFTAPAAPVVVSPQKPEKTNTLSPIVKISAEAGSTIQVLDRDEIVGSTIASADGATDVALTLPSAGVYNKLTAVAIDAAGNRSEAAKLPNLIVKLDKDDRGGEDDNEDDVDADDAADES